MSQPIKQRLENSLHGAAASGRKIASYMLANLHELPFQTSASIAAKLGVSESSVGRFCRALGYAHLKALKQDLQSDLGDGPWLVGDRLQAYRQNREAADSAGSLELEIAALVRVHEYSRGQAWQQVAQRLADKPRVFVAGFQTERGIAMCMSHLMQYLRDGVQLVDGSAGHFGEVLLGRAEDSALLVFEARRYSRHALQLCQKARQAGIPVTLVTDTFCDWAEANADEVFRIPTEFNLFWESTSAMLSWVHLMVNEVCRKLGPDVERRLEATAALHNEFVGYTSWPAGKQQ
ncbi:MurR/RpiR family transcriptional regulator [Pseudomonas guariconensis]|uniref:MurR/RpiR family transcriptional regulator n=1 Tax=Pseudomonas TaxID=286 RepID=UPI001CE3E21B|nr:MULTISPECIES: MurR/RpiR family transcriptional regulator [Pseudomonas]MCO7639077.1 MurR/RpiR family transcriptional regulator [Pseudomonas sp. S 311-6]MCO7514285.1 MurR/RpiR family transcriptional regulator [Pseudomonas putida]MCO7564826.1 MurR/RpiR family transcriptional regulator [Pseudomonas mosselii]MCO7593723.1 MurR/RpiR family transcriptional regulator [Pseudomonas guariconensis]MCO7605968.1 MurR/RpiR family transcriptional regulator [Pseudomonas guariconensis]